MGSERAACDFGSMEPDGSAPVLERHDSADRICRPAGNAPDGTVLIFAAGTRDAQRSVPGAVHLAKPVLFQQRSVTEYDLKVHFRNAVERHDGLQRAASCATKADEQRVAVPGGVHLFQVHVEQQRLLRFVGRASDYRVAVLAEHLRPEGGMGAVLLRRYSLTHSLYGLRIADRTRKAIRERHEQSCGRSDRWMYGEPHRLAAHRIPDDPLRG